jgi:uncharacterized protein
MQSGRSKQVKFAERGGWRARSRAWSRGARRWAQLITGLVLYAVAMVLLIRSGLGLGPWDAFHVGLSRWTGLSLGAIVILTGLAIIVGTWFLRVRPGPGTLANMVLIGIFADLFLLITPEATSVWVAFPYHLAGIVLIGLATGLYIAPGLGKGPRDGLMIGLSEFTGWPVGRVRTANELSVLLLGRLLGATLGQGTILFALGIGPATAWGLRLFGVTPRPPGVSTAVIETTPDEKASCT